MSASSHPVDGAQAASSQVHRSPKSDGPIHRVAGELDKASDAPMPSQLHGVWHMGEKPCGVPHPDSDGTLTITAKGWQGYEHRGTPGAVETLGDQRWIIKGEEIYLGSQHDAVTKEFALNGGALVISEPEYTEIYQRCHMEK